MSYHHNFPGRPGPSRNNNRQPPPAHNNGNRQHYIPRSRLPAKDYRLLLNPTTSSDVNYDESGMKVVTGNDDNVAEQCSSYQDFIRRSPQSFRYSYHGDGASSRRRSPLLQSRRSPIEQIFAATHLPEHHALSLRTNNDLRMRQSPPYYREPSPVEMNEDYEPSCKRRRMSSISNMAEQQSRHRKSPRLNQTGHSPRYQRESPKILHHGGATTNRPWDRYEPYSRTSAHHPTTSYHHSSSYRGYRNPTSSQRPNIRSFGDQSFQNEMPRQRQPAHHSTRDAPPPAYINQSRFSPPQSTENMLRISPPRPAQIYFTTEDGLLVPRHNALWRIDAAPLSSNLLHLLAMITTPGSPEMRSPDSDVAENYEALLHVAQRLSEDRPRGLTRQEINHIPAFRFRIQKHTGDQTSCVICMSDFEEQHLLRHLPCAHEFHTKCIDRWLRTNRTCPICRGDATADPATLSD